jgi:hypothetical protein
VDHFSTVEASCLKLHSLKPTIHESPVTPQGHFVKLPMAMVSPRSPNEACAPFCTLSASANGMDKIYKTPSNMSAPPEAPGRFQRVHGLVSNPFRAGHFRTRPLGHSYFQGVVKGFYELKFRSVVQASCSDSADFASVV